ncbi:hypothetical protein F4694_004097 [Bacillus niacini]|uniref:Uncharacterized protein n=1 Tax=Neobacillus niacini TaxID=86668 RepID=A0A852TEX3_9BACI|nr:hypothetical protein [Neobacillus niacini]NYE07312.1 hypothetical protein [Neobacillus niacini]
MAYISKRLPIKLRIFQYDEGYMAMAHDGTCGVHNCYADTEEAAEKLAITRLMEKLQKQQTQK